MKEFFLTYNKTITYAVIFFSAMMGSLYLKRSRDLRYKPFVIYLWLTLGLELLAWYPKFLENNYDNVLYMALKNSMFCYNIWLYNIYGYLGMGFIGVLYYSMLEHHFFKKMIQFIAIAYSLFIAIYFTALNSFFTLGFPYQFVVCAMILVLYALFYFYELLQTKQLLIFYKLPIVFITIGLLFWYIAALPLLMFEHLQNKVLYPKLFELRGLLIFVINSVSYGCFAFGFINAMSYDKAYRKQK